MAKQKKLSQEEIKEQYKKEYFDVSINTDRCDRKKSEEAIKVSYKYLNEKNKDGSVIGDIKLNENPEFIWLESPKEGAKLAALATALPPEVNDLSPAESKALLQKLIDDGKLAGVTDDQIRDQAGQASYGSFESYWISYYLYETREVEGKNPEIAQALDTIVRETGVFWTFKNIVICTEKPTKLHVTGEPGKEIVHCTTAKAIEYADGSGIYVVNNERKASLMEVVLADKMKAAQDEK